MQKFFGWFLTISLSLVLLGFGAFYWIVYNLTAPLPSWTPDQSSLIQWRLLMVWSILFICLAGANLVLGIYWLRHSETRKVFLTALITSIVGGILHWLSRLV